MCLTNEQINLNKDIFTSIIKQLDSSNDVEGLLKYLEESGFYEAPASSKYHCSYKGGLCEHSLNVYNIFCCLNSMLVNFIPPHFNEQGVNDTQTYLLNVAIKVALLHDLAKVNYYEFYDKYTKDENGKWVTTKDIRIKDCTKRETYGNASFNNYMILSKYLSLDNNEIVALMNYNCGMDDGYSNKDLSAILSKNSFTIMLHCADMMCTYMLEGNK